MTRPGIKLQSSGYQANAFNRYTKRKCFVILLFFMKLRIRLYNLSACAKLIGYSSAQEMCLSERQVIVLLRRKIRSVLQIVESNELYRFICNGWKLLVVHFWLHNHIFCTVLYCTVLCTVLCTNYVTGKHIRVRRPNLRQQKEFVRTLKLLK